MTFESGSVRSARTAQLTVCSGRATGVHNAMFAVIFIGAAALIAACGSGAEDAEVTDVEPRDAVFGPQAPEVGEQSADRERAEETFSPDPDAGLLEPVEETRFADAAISPAGGSGVSGHLRFREHEGLMQIEGTLYGLEQGEHGMHVHVVSDCSDPGAASERGHFAPDDDPHGSPRDLDSEHHVGDLGNLTAGESGVAEFEKTDAEMTLGTGDYTILGRAVVVHAEPDNLVSQPAGNAGDWVGCGIVEIDVDPAYLPGGDAEAVDEPAGS